MREWCARVVRGYGCSWSTKYARWQTQNEGQKFFSVLAFSKVKLFIAKVVSAVALVEC